MRVAGEFSPWREVAWGGFYHDKNFLNLMPLPIQERESRHPNFIPLPIRERALKEWHYAAVAAASFASSAAVGPVTL
jgi:hypothetical protein